MQTEPGLTDPEKWFNDEEYQRISNFIRDLKVVNNLAERCVKDIQDYNNTANDAVHRDVSEFNLSFYNTILILNDFLHTTDLTINTSLENGEYFLHF